MLRELVPLRVPGGWALVFNIFVEFAHDESISLEDAGNWLSDDILYLVTLQFDQDRQRWESQADGPHIDVSWRDPGDPNGQYVLTVTMGSDTSKEALLAHRSCQVIKNAIELAFEHLRQSDDLKQLATLFSQLGK